MSEEIHKKWLAEGGLSKLTTFDFLTPESWVWEIGGWRGWWVGEIAEKYNPWITVFEPVISSFLRMKKRFSKNPKIRIENYGLGDEDRKQSIGLSADGSGVYCQTNNTIVQIKSIKKVLGECKYDIDLVQCNCEGGEYEIFPQLIKTGLIKRFKFIIIQFHDLHESHTELRKQIQKDLEKTHTMVMCYDWKFEYWRMDA